MKTPYKHNISRQRRRTFRVGLLIVFMFFPLQLTNGLDWVLQGYLPSLFSFVSGKGAVFHQFSEVVEDRFILPFEAKFLVRKLGAFAFSANGIISFYIEDSAFGSLNLSTGLGISRAKEEKSPLQGFYFSLYPIYELPAIAPGKTSLFTWRSAMDIGFGFNFLSRTNIYISIYSRMICFWKDSSTSFGAIPDFGITLGWHFRDRMYIN
jgi:hypothetical protein